MQNFAHSGIFRHIVGSGGAEKITNLKTYWVKVPWVKFGGFGTSRGWEINFFRQNIGMFDWCNTQTYALQQNAMSNFIEPTTTSSFYVTTNLIFPTLGIKAVTQDIPGHTVHLNVLQGTWKIQNRYRNHKLETSLIVAWACHTKTRSCRQYWSHPALSPSVEEA